MGDSRSWAADREDDIKVCQFGAESRYFDTCQCSGCKALRDRNARISILAKKFHDAAFEKYKKTPDEKWDSITSISL